MTLDAPERGNSLDAEMLTRLEELLTNLDPAVRVVVLTGAGERSFSTGYTISGMVFGIEE